MYGATKEGAVATGKGTIKLGETPGEFKSFGYAKEIFTEWFDAIRDMQKENSVRIRKCITNAD